MTLRYYRAVLEAGAPGNGISVFFPDFPGCTSHGEDEQRAAVLAAEALALHVEGMVESEEALPMPSALNDPLPEWAADEEGEVSQEAGRVLVPVEVANRAVRTNITLDEGLLARVDLAASEEGNTRSGFIAAALRQRLNPGIEIVSGPKGSAEILRFHDAEGDCWAVFNAEDKANIRHALTVEGRRADARRIARELVGLTVQDAQEVAG